MIDSADAMRSSVRAVTLCNGWKNLRALVHEVRKRSEPGVILDRDCAEQAVLLSIDAYASLEKTACPQRSPGPGRLEVEPKPVWLPVVVVWIIVIWLIAIVRTTAIIETAVIPISPIVPVTSPTVKVPVAAAPIRTKYAGRSKLDSLPRACPKRHGCGRGGRCFRGSRDPGDNKHCNKDDPENQGR